MRLQPPQLPAHLPRAPIWRRGCAFGIDFLATSLVVIFFPNVFVQGILFIILWLANRCIWATRNQGQSLGRWLLDMKVVDPERRRLPSLTELTKREGLAGGVAMLAMLGLPLLANRTAAAGFIIFAIPLAVDCGVAWFDELYQQAFHDRLAGTIVVSTQRGFSLDLKVRKWVALARSYVQK